MGAVALLDRTERNLLRKQADACLVHLAGELQTADILTLDSDFEIYRWGANKPFQLLLKNIAEVG